MENKLINTVFKSYPKVNLFLKIVGKDGDYHEIFSRFLRVNSIYDEVSFQKNLIPQKDLKVIGNFAFPTEKNIIYQTYKSLLKIVDKDKGDELQAFFKDYSIRVKKEIPMMAGLGGGSSNSATFLNMVNSLFELNLTIEDKLKVVENIGSDIAFFLYDIESANVYGRGEIIEPLSEEPLNIEIYKSFREDFFKIEDMKELSYLKKMSSKEIFRELNLEFANDLYRPAKKICIELESFEREGFLFSGSGSSFFKILE
jgi:4-diphosphocytidyl-2-C-methyl-D-erythritol kinase